MIPLLDTNVLVRFLTSDRSPAYKELYVFFQGLERGERHVELRLIVLFQTVFVLKSFYKIPKQDIADGMMGLLEYKGLAMKEKRVVRRMIEIWKEHEVDIVDCYLVASLEGHSDHVLYSYDKDFDRFQSNRKEP